jgi:uncharacterized cofD-like protein
MSAVCPRPDWITAGPLPRRIVALGGGTGLPSVLRGMRDLVVEDDLAALTAVVTVADDGGSSGRLRRSYGVLPPGDIRNCLVALAREEDLLAGLFQHRYGGDSELRGHSLGNLILTALAEQTGSFLKAVEASSSVLRTVGRILPASLEDVVLEAILTDGTIIVGESAIGHCKKRIRRLRLSPSKVEPTPDVIESILEADLVVIGPGSLFTSLLPNLLVEGIADAVRQTTAVRVLVGNLVSEHGEASGLNIDDHLRVIEEHIGTRSIDAALVNEGVIDTAVLGRYRAEGVTPLTLDGPDSSGITIVKRDLLAPGRKLRHDPTATAAGLIAAWRQLQHPALIRHAK